MIKITNKINKLQKMCLIKYFSDILSFTLEKNIKRKSHMSYVRGEKNIS